MSWHIMPPFERYEIAREDFQWDLPPGYHPVTDLLEKHADTQATALRYFPDPNDSPTTYTFDELIDQSGRLAAALDDLGVAAGDRVGVVVGQRPANPLSHFAIWRLGALTVPMTVLFGPDALEYRIRDSGASVVIVEAGSFDAVARVRENCPTLETVIIVGDSTPDGADHRFEDLLHTTEAAPALRGRGPESDTAIMYTSGSTGPPKGVKHRHALWLGRAAAAYNYFERSLEDATTWTPADWAWGAALGGTVFATWHYGGTVVGWPRTGFDAEQVFQLLERDGVTHAFLPPTALRKLMHVADPMAHYDLALDTLASVGEPLTPEIVDWVEQSFEDVPINEFYGQTELNLVIGNSAGWFQARPGSMGRTLPGYRSRVVDPETGASVEHGETGELQIRADDDRVFFDGYWEQPAATAEKVTEDGWYRTGDLVEKDADGYHWFVSRADDIILTRGYRVGPGEVESALLEHPTVEQVGVIGVPHDTYGEAIKAVVEPVEQPPDASTLTDELQSFVREHLAAYEYPDEIEFVDELPTTSSGKIRRSVLREQSTGSD